MPEPTAPASAAPAAFELAAFDYALPEASIAQAPLAERDASRLLVALPGGGVEHRHTRDLPSLVRAGDVVVVNETKVRPARLRFTRDSGGAGEVLLLEPRGDGTWLALARPSRKLPPGSTVVLGDDLAIELGDDLGEGRRVVRLHTADLDAALERHGVLPLPPYITAPVAEPERYQTVYATRPGSAAAPTAGLHLTPAVLAGIEAAGARLERVELVVGLDTFRPIQHDDVREHRMHTERYRVPESTWQACAEAHERGGRVIAIGTTSVRALESAAARGELEGRTDLFITRGFQFRVVDVLLTNFHLPRSTLLVMIDAFVGPRWRDLYATALSENYRFLSFGDAMLLERDTTTTVGMLGQ